MRHTVRGEIVPVITIQKARPQTGGNQLRPPPRMRYPADANTPIINPALALIAVMWKTLLEAAGSGGGVPGGTGISFIQIRSHRQRSPRIRRTKTQEISF
jgi:hypothetical protein